MQKILIFLTVIWVVFTSADFLEVMDAFNKMK